MELLLRKSCSAFYQLQVKEKEPSRFKYVAMGVLLCLS